MSDYRPSDIEQLLLLTTWRLGDEAYGLAIQDELSTHTNRRFAVGAIYSTLVRMERRGWIRSHLSDPTPVRGGKAKRYFHITSLGIEAALAARDTMDRLWDGLEAPNTRGEGA